MGDILQKSQKNWLSDLMNLIIKKIKVKIVQRSYTFLV